MAARPDAPLDLPREQRLEQRLAALFHAPVIGRTALSGGNIAELSRADFADGRTVAVKCDHSATPRLATEAAMLRFLKSTAPAAVAAVVPAVLHAEPDLLVLEFCPGSQVRTPAAEQDLGAILAALHSVTAPQFGFDSETLIGGLPQLNPWTARWVDFFRDQRVLAMAHAAHRTGSLPAATLRRIEAFAPRFESLLPEPAQPALLHGDLWSGNALGDSTRVTGLIDPAIYFGHPEIELAFTTLFHSFGPAFYQAYEAHTGRAIPQEFWSERKDLYNLYPLLVHVHLFDPPGGGSYTQQLLGTLRRFA